MSQSKVTTFHSYLKVAHYISMIATEPLEVDGHVFAPPKRIVVSPTFWRDWVCHPQCGGCCRSFSMDFFEESLLTKQTPSIEPHTILVNGTSHTIWSNRTVAYERWQNKQYCEFLTEGGLCGIHGQSPLSCRFELNKLQYSPKRDEVWLGKKLFRNGWRYQRIDGEVGAICEMTPVTEQTIALVKKRDVGYLTELSELADRWGVIHRGYELCRLLLAAKGEDFNSPLICE